jgi:hypothetical protein
MYSYSGQCACGKSVEIPKAVYDFVHEYNDLLARQRTGNIAETSLSTRPAGERSPLLADSIILRIANELLSIFEWDNDDYYNNMRTTALDATQPLIGFYNNGQQIVVSLFCGGRCYQHYHKPTFLASTGNESSSDSTGTKYLGVYPINNEKIAALASVIVAAHSSYQAPPNLPTPPPPDDTFPQAQERDVVVMVTQTGGCLPCKKTYNPPAPIEYEPTRVNWHFAPVQAIRRSGHAIRRVSKRTWIEIGMLLVLLALFFLAYFNMLGDQPGKKKSITGGSVAPGNMNITGISNYTISGGCGRPDMEGVINLLEAIEKNSPEDIFVTDVVTVIFNSLSDTIMQVTDWYEFIHCTFQDPILMKMLRDTAHQYTLEQLIPALRRALPPA